MTPPQEPRTGGVAVTRRYAVPFIGTVGYAYRETRQPGPADGLTMIVGDEYGTWFPLAEAEAREAVVAAARAYAEAIEPDAWQRFDAADVKRTYRALVAALADLTKGDA